MPEPVTLNRRIARTVEANGWSMRLGISLGMAGFLALMGAISFPLPWTPVPFSMMPFALLVAGGYQRPGYAALSVAIYLLAGAAGAPIYADRSSGWEHLWGPTAGYLFGFVLVSALVSRYMQRRREPLSAAWLWTIGGFLAAAVVAGITAIAWMWSTGNGLAHLDSEVTGDWGVGKTSLWFLLFLTAACTALTLVLLNRYRGDRPQALNLFVVMLGSIVILHACGVTVLWLAIEELSLISAIILGSLVFLPFDIVKAGLGVGLTLPFLPSPESEEHHA